jgi:hypothetical protein
LDDAIKTDLARGVINTEKMNNSDANFSIYISLLFNLVYWIDYGSLKYSTFKFQVDMTVEASVPQRACC